MAAADRSARAGAPVREAVAMVARRGAPRARPGLAARPPLAARKAPVAMLALVATPARVDRAEPELVELPALVERALVELPALVEQAEVAAKVASAEPQVVASAEPRVAASAEPRVALLGRLEAARPGTRASTRGPIRRTPVARAWPCPAAACRPALWSPPAIPWTA
jgi:hypothetical protein